MRKGKNPYAEALLGLLAWIFILWAIWCFVYYGVFLGFIAIILTIFGIGLIGALAIALINALKSSMNAPKKNVALKEMENSLANIIDAHSYTIERKLRTAVKYNDYGLILSDSSDDVIVEFLESVPLAFDWRIIQSEAIDFTKNHLSRLSEERKRLGFSPEDLPSNGIDFEYWCADSFRLFGWDAEVTKSGGDQGLDVIVQKNGVRIGIQTKLYGSPVGNKAVQEAHAGTVFYGLDKAAVLTNAGFTKSAIDLAASTSVVLMSQYDIPKADDLLL